MFRGVPSAANLPMRAPSGMITPSAKPPAMAWITPEA